MQIGSSNDSEAVKTQYATSKGLNTRLSFHDKYSTNKQGYGNWIVSNYVIPKGMKILEVGCGTGSIWLGQNEIISKLDQLMLTDLSEGMIKTAKENLGERDNIDYIVADIQELPFEDDSFDVVIANSMLYHVPNLNKGIREVRRVLKEDGLFYCATLGENNFVECLAELFKLNGESFKPNHNFTMQNGEQKLKTAFSNVEARFYEDSLHITDIEELIKYLQSLTSFKAIKDFPIKKVREILEAHSNNGVINLPKEYGMFISRG